MGKIAVLSHVVVDEIVQGPSDEPTIAIGGAGAYAAVGASMGSSSGVSLIVAGTGAADHEMLGAWFAEREIDAGGLFTVGAYGPRTHIEYLPDGERIETPLHGLDHFNAHTPLPAHIPVPIAQVSGTYLFHDHDDAYWRTIETFRLEFSGPLMWEISRDSCHPNHWSAVEERLALVDIFSINRSEMAAMFGMADIQTAIRRLGQLPCSVVLRCGAEGSILIHGSSVTKIGVLATTAVDPTGGGNSYSGAYLAAFAESGDERTAGRIAAAAAAAVVSQYGAPLVDETLRQEIFDSAQHVSAIKY